MLICRLIAEDTDGRVLLVQRAAGDRFPGCWELPGGKVDVGESPLCALRREILEETGLTLAGDPDQVSSRQLRTPSGKTATELVFRAAVSGTVQLSAEHQDTASTSPGTGCPITAPTACCTCSEQRVSARTSAASPDDQRTAGPASDAGS